MHSSDTLSPAEPPQTDQDSQSGRHRRSAKSRKHPRRRFLLGGAAVLGLAATGTSAWALNRFVIDHVEVDDVTALEAKAQNAVASSSAAPATNETVGENSYSSSNTSIEIQQVSTGSGNDTVTYYVADVKLTNATDLRSAFANNSFGTNITAKPSVIASEHDAILAINGDYYGFRSDGILIRNGVIYRDSGKRDGMAFYTDGRVEVYDETTTNAQTLLDAGVWNTLSFGPALVNGGQVLSGIDQVEVDTNVGNHSIQGKQPRTAVGWVETNHLKLVVVDGRSEGYSRGVTMTELAQIMADLGCACAYNIDGGGSSAMYFNGSIINQPSNGGERDTSDILYIANGS
ncbi:phosphodiester glycosidase family protein [Actinomyces viscosus]|uniref:Exopolysaccharide biosynthesis protein related to N-acetylglucosamine-1-phosphodiester alpha-N-acetylglucosaminidase n=1 Tax=Actinomyces viscosus TaxID=1656 RepID=A0A3S4Z3A6_ACTVI|nr:phosphodiester glycosidase family protein [Actinomyces viscosus]TFH53326.1 phosphodiester glycosidase family protein [Actinomyces viscosus]VEI18007.1 Exopolysaccharide biosynthesis protein related to N-acetylglucosamine-1-phosphodiester alpha-N-acetylglucosaminidase [Actinomyces viscosus]